ncbi:MAG TPA: Uma2 family endonuclease [Phycisphaerae bacterium]|nr:Uma2 family endonuclease [Phycisphaerae bacterium]
MTAIAPRSKASIQGRPARRMLLGPADDGRRVSLELFARAEAQPGFLYELGNGVIEVTEIPGMPHNWVVEHIEILLRLYQAAHREVVAYMSGGIGAQVELWGRETERHPDISIYLSPPPQDVDQLWDRWVPEIVIEVVSASSAKRDYGDKADDYLAAGVREYWLIDPLKKIATFHTRRGDMWDKKTVGTKGKWKTRLLPGFTLELSKVFAASNSRRRGK